MNESPYDVVNSLINKIEKYLWYRHYRDGVLDRSTIRVYLGEKERKSLLTVHSYAEIKTTENTLLGCKVIFVKEESHFNIV